MTVNMNQFVKTAFVGQLDLQAGGLSPSFTLRIDPDSNASDIEAGVGLKIVDGSTNDPNGVPLCDVLGADTEQSFGARIYSTKSGVVQPGDIVQVSYDGCVQRMEAAAALARGAFVSLVVATPGTVAAVSTNAPFGMLLDKSFAAGDIVRVLVKTGPNTA
jgi:hypothetical protein